MPNFNEISKKTTVEQLELRVYSREELASILNVDIKDSNHFKRNVENKLIKWGYSYKYCHRKFEIIKVPTTAHERLAEIMMRAYQIDVRMDTVSFACFLYSLATSEEFSAMPWEERSQYLFDNFDVQVSDRTLRNWCSKFIKKGYISKDYGHKVQWMTTIYKGEKRRDIVNDETLKEFADKYRQRKHELLQQYKDLDSHEKWKTVMSTLWREYQCCFYYCKGLNLSAWTDEVDANTIQEMIELVDEIAEQSPTEIEYIIQQDIK